MNMSAPEALTGNFPKGFLWGAATSSFQIEGAATADGKSRSIWDTFCRTPGRVHKGQTGDVACDHYHRMEEDVDLMAEMGLHAYRFSVAWPRILPDGKGVVNQKGLDFYDRLVDRLLSKGIKPYVTLYHWDLPQILEDCGGWRSRETSFAFAELAAATAERLGDRIVGWSTFNEPFCIAYLGHKTGHHAPGLREGMKTVHQVYHQILLAHGLGYSAIKAALPNADVGFVHNIHPHEPVFQDQTCIDKGRELFRHQNAWLLDPLFHGKYPEDLWEELATKDELPEVTEGDMEIIGNKLDFLGFNTYSSGFATHAEFGELKSKKFHPKTDMGWDINPDSLYWVARYLHELYGEKRLYVTENGCAYPDEVDENGHVIDLSRINYYRQHLRGVARAIAEGFPVEGYFAWSLLDNFEWAYGYDKQFGMIHVNFETLKRTPKLSAHWYKEVISRNCCG